MRPPLRVAILECDTPLEGAKGEYYGIFSSLLRSAAKTFGAEKLDPEKDLQISKWHVEISDMYPEAKYPPLDEIDAVLISGSRFNAFDDDPWIKELVSWTSKLLQQDRVRIIGVCFGHQIIGRALGTNVIRNDQWEISVCDMDLTSKGKELFKLDRVVRLPSPRAWSRADGKQMIHQMHRDILTELPAFPNGKPAIESLGYSDKCKVQGLYAEGKFISVQGHPEFFEDLAHALLDMRHSQGIIGDDDYQSGIKRVQDHHDGIGIAATFLRFLLED